MRFDLGSRELLFLIIFSLLALQMLLSLIQVRQYQNAVRKLRGQGILGIGQRRGKVRPGEILILVYNPREDRVVSAQSMRGYTVFAHFKEISEYRDRSLEEMRTIGIEKDGQEMRFYRKRHPYDPATPSKKKGALIQAVEAIDGYLRRKKDAEE
ncbi:hypothetical protein AGMMS49942_07970 [Spirochaetia bacterium]|nr:hypothetical protein AGMMS49942_07970 [Spirochaetia bacterium]